MASPPVIVNHSVVRAGASARASAAGLAAYAGTRRGVVIEISEADGRRLGVDGLAAYAANRTGSTGGLWGADGPVPVAEARRAIAQNGGAVLTTVVTVPNDIAPGAGLDRLDAWQALVRSEWPRLFSEMTGVPESRVEFYAAMHINGTSHHVHILTIDREGDWDSLLPKGKMEAARLEISSKAMAPLLREAYIERDLARKAALEAVARIDRGKLDIGLPPNGRIEAAHLRRFHPEASAALREALGRAASDSPALAGALERHRKAVERCAGLKCLTGEARDVYVRKAAADLGLRCENAALRVIVPDRTPAREEVPTRRAPNRPRDGEAAGSRTHHRGPGLHPEDAPRKARAKGRARPDPRAGRPQGVSHGRPGLQACAVARSGPRARRRDGDPGRQGSHTGRQRTRHGGRGRREGAAAHRRDPEDPRLRRHRAVERPRAEDSEQDREDDHEMKPKSFNRDMKRELAGTLAAHGVDAVIACAAAAGAWDYARWWTLSLISGLSVLLRLPTADPGPEPTYVFRGPLEAAADAAASGQAGELLAALALVAASVLALGFVSWGRSWARLHDGTFAGDRAPTRTHGDAWLESRPSRVARRCPPWDGKAAAEGLVAAGCIGGGIAMVPAVHCLIRAGSGAGKSRRALAPSIAAAIDRNAHGIPTSVIVHDPKSEIRAWTEPLARRAGMEVVAIRLDEPVKSARFNPLDRAIAALGTEGTAGAVAELRELSSAIVPDAFSSGQRFFTDASRNLLTGLCLLAITDERIPDGARNLSTVLALLEPRDGKSAVKSLEELAADLPAGNPARQFLLVASSNGGGGEALVSTARNYLMSFCDDDVSRMLWDGEVDLASVGRKPTILYIASATDRGDRGALVSCIFSQALSALRETARLSGGRLPAETLLAIDEGSGIPKIPRLLGDLAEVRSIGLHVVFVLQNTHLLEARCGYSRAESDALLALLGTQVVLSVESVGEAEEISKRLGDYSVRTTGESSTKGTQSSSSGKSFSVARRPLITPSELMAWSARENGALVIDAGGPMALASRDITETFLGPLLGLTSPEAEGALLARALEGETRNTSPAPVWRIPEKPKKPKGSPPGGRKRKVSAAPDGF